MQRMQKYLYKLLINVYFRVYRHPIYNSIIAQKMKEITNCVIKSGLLVCYLVYLVHATNNRNQI